MRKIFILLYIWVGALAVIKAQETPCTATTLPVQSCTTTTPTYTTVTIGATSDIPAATSTCNDNGRDAWVKIVVPAGVEGLAIYVNNYGGCTGASCLTDVTGEWYAQGATCSNLTQFSTCFNLDLSSSVVARLYGIPASGGTYYIRITEDGNQGGFVSMAAMANSGDNINAPIPLTSAGGQSYCNYWAAGNDCTAAASSGSCIGTIDNSIFYSFTVSASTVQPINFNLSGISCAGTMQMAVVSAGCTGSALASACGITSSAQQLVAPTLANGNYLLVVDGTSGDKCSWSINSTITCGISAIAVTPTASCNDNGTPADLTDDYYLANVVVTYSGIPSSGTLNLTGSALHSTNTVSSVAVGSTTSSTSHTFTGVRLKANGVVNALTAAFSALSTCTFTNSSIPAVSTLPATVSVTGTTSFCTLTSTTLTATTGTGYTYSWAASAGGTISGSTTGSSIVATTAGTYTVSVSNAAGCVKTASATITINAASAPTIGGTTSICSGASTVLSAGAVYNAYTWAASAGGTISGSTTGANITATTAGNYNLTITNASGCTASATKTVTAVVNPAVPTITGANSVCSGASTTLNGGVGYTTYAWTATGGGATSGATNAQNLTAVGAGTYNLVVSNTGGCTASASKAITGQSAVNVCENGSFTASVSGANVSGGFRTTYFIVSNGLVKARNTTGVFNLAAAGLTAAANANNCLVYVVNDDGTATLPLVGAAYSITGFCYTQSSSCITINPIPSATISGVATICSGSPTTLTAPANASYNWAASLGGVISGSTTGQSIAATTAGTYALTVTSAAGCTASATPLVVISFANPVTPTIIGAATVCTGGSTTLDAGIGYTTYSWAASSGGAISGSSTLGSLTAVSSGTYNVTVTNTAGCSASATKTLGVAAPISVCENGSFTAAATGANVTAPYRRTYFVVASGIVKAQNTTGVFNLASMGLTAAANANDCVVYVVNDNGSATLPAVNAAYAVTGSCYTQASSCITINAPTTLSVTGVSTFCPGGSAVLTGIAGFTSYNWSTSGGTISGATNAATALASAAGTYTLTATNANGCTSTSSQTVTVNVASNQVVLATSVTNALPLPPYCEDAGWTYYTNPADNSQWYFAVRWNPSGIVGSNAAAKAAAEVTLGVSNPVSTWVPIPNGAPGYYAATDPASSQATFVMQRYWNVRLLPTNAYLDEPVNIKFFFDPAEYDAVINAANAWSLANGGYVEGPVWFKTISNVPAGLNNSFDPATDINPVQVEPSGWVMPLTPNSFGYENGVRYVQFNGIQSFSGGGLTTGVGTGTPLPLSLLYFAGYNDGPVNRLNWETTNEINTNHFELERSLNAINFAPIGNVLAAGNSTSNLLYNFTDEHPQLGNNYYRLKMIDNDGSYEYSNIINIPLRSDRVEVVRLYPNPTFSTLSLDLYAPADEDVQVNIIDAIGQIVKTEKLSIIQGMNTSTFDVTNLSAGVYVVSFTCCGGQTYQQKFVKAL